MDPSLPIDDHGLLRAYGAGDADAFTELTKRTSGMVHATCVRILGDAQLAQDATQETFLQLMRSSGAISGCVKAWLHRVATSKSLDLLRAEARLRRRQQAAEPPVEAQAWNELSARVDEALEELEEGQRILLVRRFLHGLSQEELARELSVSQATISRQLSDALDGIRERLRRGGVIASVALLDRGWSVDRSMPLPSALQHQLGKMALTTPVAAGGVGLAWIAVAGVLMIAITGITVAMWRASTHVIARAVVASAPALPEPKPIATAQISPQASPASVDEHIDPALMTRAVTAVCLGDATTLRQLLHDHPALVRARVENDSGNYSGYFHHATLLHHVAGNPLPAKIPDNVVEIARILLAAGAEVDAHTDAGPSQPTDPGWSTLALVVSCGPSMHAHMNELVDVLIDAGAKIDDQHGEVLGGALQYACWDGVVALRRHEVTLDLLFAAGVGDVEKVKSFFAADGQLKPGAVFLCGFPQSPHGPLESQGGYATSAHESPATQAESLAEALVFATLCEENTHRLEVVRFLLDHGAKPSMTKLGHSSLHTAAWIDDQAICRLLLNHGADANAQDAQYHSSPAGWADYHNHPACAKLIRSWKPGDGELPPPERSKTPDF